MNVFKGRKRGLKSATFGSWFADVISTGCPGGDRFCCFRNILGRAEEEQRQARYGTVQRNAFPFDRWKNLKPGAPTLANRQVSRFRPQEADVFQTSFS